MSREQQRYLDSLITIERLARTRPRHCADRPTDSPTLVRGTDLPGGRHTA